ncbi:thermonuclease family protein [Paenibacillus sp. A3]|uniref:thermonuclease family protein n=1 Tax=Paenibacillus sp. A3 TaxID=1337054 RepID=UPI0006D5A43D|nr:thermonuclease family protein [Paenibacillus sp. A3]
MNTNRQNVWTTVSRAMLNTVLGAGLLLSGFAGTGNAEVSASSVSPAAEPTVSAAASGTISIAQARQLPPGVEFTVRGEVTAVYPKSNAFIHDGTAGLRIYGYDAARLRLGSEIDITGRIKNYNNELELVFPFTTTELPGDQFPTPPPLEVSLDQVGEANAGQFVKVKNVWVTEDYNSGDGGVKVTDGNNSVVIFALDQPDLRTYLQNLPKDPSQKFDIVGASSVFRSTKQIFPRGEADIVPAQPGGGTQTTAPAAVKLTFDNRTPVAARLSGSSGSVPASSTVKLYANAAKGAELGSGTADGNGAFAVTFDNSAQQLQTVYVSATVAGKAESGLTAVSAQSSGGDTFDVTVTHISDGDTFNFSPSLTVDGKSVHIVRMLNIDTPETAQTPFGDQATQVLQSLITTGTAVKLELDQVKVDGYGRLLAHVYRKSDNLDVNKEMLKRGAAINYYIYPNMKYFADYGAAAKEASLEGKGIWNPGQPLSKLPYEYRAAGCMERYVGDSQTKKYYVPKRYNEIPFENRVFFGYDKLEPRSAGYTPADPADPNHNPATDCSTGSLKTIAEVRSNWNPDTTYQVVGELTAVLAPDHAFVQDTTGGIHLYGKIPADLQVGQEVKVDGNVQEFYGDLEFKNARIEKLNQDRIPTPVPLELKLDQVAESNEGRLIAVRNVWITSNYSGGNGGIRITDDTGTEVVVISPTKGGTFLAELQKLPKGKQNKFDIVGGSSVWSSLREIYPRSLTDIVPAGGSGGQTGSVKGTVKAEGRSVQSAIEITAKHQASGKETKITASADGSFTIPNLTAGSYTVTANLKHCIPVKAAVIVQDRKAADLGNLAAPGNGGSKEGLMRGGNVYPDAEINIYDAVTVGVSINKTTPEALEAADINGDGAVNQADLDLVEKNFLAQIAN